MSEAPDDLRFTVGPGDKLADVERKLITATLLNSPTKTEAAETLGISLKTLYNRINEYNRK